MKCACTLQTAPRIKSSTPCTLSLHATYALGKLHVARKIRVKTSSALGLSESHLREGQLESNMKLFEHRSEFELDIIGRNVCLFGY